MSDSPLRKGAKALGGCLVGVWPRWRTGQPPEAFGFFPPLLRGIFRGGNMKAAVWHGRQDVRIEEVHDPPAPAPGQVQVEVAWCGICGTDLHEYLGGRWDIQTTEWHSLTGVK